jgi:hypothetical protein
VAGIDADVSYTLPCGVPRDRVWGSLREVGSPEAETHVQQEGAIVADIAFLLLIFLALFGANVACVHYVRWLDRKPRMPEVLRRWL